MIDILLGAGIMLVFFLCLATAYYIGRRHNKTAAAQQLSEQEELELQKRLKGVENVLNYDYDVALGRRQNK